MAWWFGRRFLGVARVFENLWVPLWAVILRTASLWGYGGFYFGEMPMPSSCPHNPNAVEARKLEHQDAPRPRTKEQLQSLMDPQPPKT